MQFYKIYNSLETLPIYNFDKVQQNNDLRFLLRLKNYDRMPKMNKWLMRDLLRIYKHLMSDYSNKENRVLSAKKRAIKAITELTINIANNSHDADKIHKASVLLRALMIDTTKDELLRNTEWLETAEQRMLMTHIKIAIKKYKEQVDKVANAKKITIQEQQARLESMLGININVKQCSVKQWEAYIKEVNNKSQILN